MSERDALLRAVCADPADDTVRLAFADWCEENGEPDRAAFVLTQVELAKGPPACHCFMYGCDESFGDSEEVGCFKRWNRLRRRERELTPGDRLYYATGPYDYVTVTPDCFRRGFVESVAVDGETWVRHGDGLLSAQPITVVRLTTLPAVSHGSVGEPHRGRHCWFTARRDKPVLWVPFLQYPDAGHPRAVAALLADYWPRVAFTFPA